MSSGPLQERLEGAVFWRGRRGRGVASTSRMMHNQAPGEDAHGVGMVMSAGSGSGVEVGGPGVGVWESPAKSVTAPRSYFVDGPAEADDGDLFGSAGRGSCAGQAASWMTHDALTWDAESAGCWVSARGIWWTGTRARTPTRVPVDDVPIGRGRWSFQCHDALSSCCRRSLTRS